ncbi:hypothetical protein COT97_03000 [Candidatus Falkowbacteria bacterium CG10_big_fil_rev_8_21_14_0_10_39_11]|uniref:Uncharacterized protein n=1 Tax=Candidatus Falkowbacteria bacterium CG10_big_fil_rev_8_21_14_0_10_39_11 TaxID=1974565 RepID=A0A2H0V4V1_9BACT|nr:MAG: hypothetical protein COT97_03000 [Candidatus Falkowbacteria bacterium CG10_big_fil_rev_8_21_14_0_10_39_11]
MLTKSIFRLFKSYNKPELTFDEDEVIRVNQVIGTAALIYEKIRNAVDYREDHLLRKNALFRILKRKLFIEKILINQSEDKLAEQIVHEMIRAGYLKNNQEPKEKIFQVLTVLKKYNTLIQAADLGQKHFMWLLELEACEMEEILVPDDKEKALTRFAFEVMNHRVVTNRGEIDDKEKELQLFLSIQRAIRKPDDAMLSYVLWGLYYPSWKQADDELIVKVAHSIVQIKKQIDEQLNHPWKNSLNKITRRWTIVFWTIQDIIFKDPGEAEAIFSDEIKLELAINKACQARYKDVRKKLRRGVIRSIIYVFFTKMLLALVLELPLDVWLKGFVNYTTLGINVLFPPVLMFFVAITIRTPGKKNTEMILREIKTIVYNFADQQKFKLKAPKKRSTFTSMILNFLYMVVFAASVYFIFIGLSYLDFAWFSALIFVFFLSVVSFFGLRIRKPVKEISLEEKRDNIFTLLLDFISLPFATFGQWSSVKFSKINIVAFFFDFIIEAPFKIFIEVLEDLFSFWREKKEEAFDQQ